MEATEMLRASGGRIQNAGLPYLQLAAGMQLLSIRSVDIAFTMGTVRPLLKKKEKYCEELRYYN